MTLSPSDAQKLVEITRKHGGVSAAVFGSVARGEAQSGSDLDLLVEFESGRSLFDLIRLEHELQDTLGLPVDVLTPNSLHPRIRERVMREKIPVL